MSASANILFLHDAADDPFLEMINKQLGRAFRKIHTLRSYHDVPPGSDQDDTLNIFLKEAQLVVVLASADYWSSGICDLLHDKALDLMEAKKLILVPVLVRDHLWEQELGDIAVLPKNKTAINKFPLAEQETACKEVALEIRQLAETLGSSKDQSSRIETLADSIYLLNYNEQRVKVADYYQKFGNQFNPLNIFLVRGTALCGHRLLVDILRREYSIRMDGEPLPFPLELVGDKPSLLWNELRNALEFRDVTYQDKAGIAQRILRRLEHENIILLFENIEQCPRQDILPAINEFWHELNNHLEYLNTKQVANRFFIFINDRACDGFDYQLELFCSQQPDPLPERIVQLLPGIHPVGAAEINTWLTVLFNQGMSFRGLWSELKNKQDNITLAVPSSGLYMRQAVEQIVDQLDLSPHKAAILNRLKL